MVCVAAKKVKENFPGYRGDDKWKCAWDESIVNNEPETQHEKHRSAKGKFSNVVGYVDL